MEHACFESLAERQFQAVCMHTNLESVQHRRSQRQKHAPMSRSYASSVMTCIGNTIYGGTYKNSTLLGKQTQLPVKPLHFLTRFPSPVTRRHGSGYQRNPKADLWFQLMHTMHADRTMFCRSTMAMGTLLDDLAIQTNRHSGSAAHTFSHLAIRP